MSKTELKSNNDKYEDLFASLNVYYWDNQISPNETACKLEEFSKEVSRLVKFIRDNGNEQTRAAEHRNEAEESIPAACHELHEQWMKLYNFCPECGTRVTPLS